MERFPPPRDRPSAGTDPALVPEPNGQTPGILPMKGPPQPIDVTWGYYAAATETITAMANTWAPGDSERCRRCPVCTARGDRCLVIVGMYVAPEDVRGFAIRSLTDPLGWRGIG